MQAWFSCVRLVMRWSGHVRGTGVWTGVCYSTREEVLDVNRILTLARLAGSGTFRQALRPALIFENKGVELKSQFSHIQQRRLVCYVVDICYILTRLTSLHSPLDPPSPAYSPTPPSEPPSPSKPPAQ
jgi:hypothetical protein